MSQLDLRNSSLVKAVAALTNNHDFVTSISKKPTSFEKQKKKIKDKSEVNLPVPELKNDDNIKESSSCPHSSLSLGPYSDNIGFGINDISNYKSFYGRSIFNLQMVQFWKLGQYRQVNRHFTWDHFPLLLATFTGEEKISPQLLKKN